MKLKSTLIVLSLTALTLPAFAQTPPKDPAATPGIDKRLDNQDKRIDQGEKSGALTPREAGRLETREAKTEELPYPASTSILDLDEDFLELPPVEGEHSSEDVTETATETAEPVKHGFIRETTTSESVAESATPTISIDSPHISAELIDLIVQKVIEKMSDKAVKDVAWEVVPQMSELIIRQIAEEKLKD